MKLVSLQPQYPLSLIPWTTPYQLLLLSLKDIRMAYSLFHLDLVHSAW